MNRPYLVIPAKLGGMADEWLAVGVEHQMAGRLDEAELAYRRGQLAEPAHLGLAVNLGVLAAQRGRTIEAWQGFERALVIDNKSATAWHNLAHVFLELDRADYAHAAIVQELALRKTAAGFATLGQIMTELGDGAGALDAYQQALALDPRHVMAGHNELYCRAFVATTPESDRIARARWHQANRFAGPIDVAHFAHKNDADPLAGSGAGRPLRVGYVCGDFKMHSAAFAFAAIILQHDPAKVRPYCYMTMDHNPQKDEWTKRFMDGAEWRDISNLGDDAAEALIRQDRIDILVDLSGHTGGNRLPLFTRKPAPIQATGWGLTGTGCPEIDYLFSDEFIIPPAQRGFYVEEIVDLPHFFSYVPPDYDLPGSTPSPFSRDGIFTFGVFGRLQKMSEEAFAAWRRILERVPDSRLLLKDGALRHAHAMRRVMSFFPGIDPARIVTAGHTSHAQHLLTYQLADLVLDTFPQTNGMGALEILHMGVPILTLCGEQPWCRAGAAVLRGIGRPEWIADSVDYYVEKAVALAASPRELGAARPGLRASVLASPFCGGEYVKPIEDAYRAMWQRYCGEEAVGRLAATA